MTNPLLSGPARTTGRVFVWALLAVLVLAIAGALWVGIRGIMAYTHLRDAESAARQLTSQLDDPAAAAARVPAITDDLSAAHDLTADPVWGAASALPWIGPQLDAFATVAAAADTVGTSALAPLVDVAAGFSVDALRPTDGRIDVTGFAEIHEASAASVTAVDGALRSLNAIEQDELLPPLVTGIDDVTSILDSAMSAADAVSRATALMPAMLGQDGPRNYLIVFQNNAEWRSLGGIVGAMAMIHTEGGSMSLAQQASSSDFTRYDGSVLELDSELLAITGEKPGIYIQNATQATTFPAAAELAREMWARETGVTVDGVLSLDPVSLSYLLAATGPITLPTGDVLSSENAVQLLLNDVYQRYSVPAEQDLFFEAAAASVFAAVSGGGADPAKLVASLAQAAQERRLLIWNANPDEQAVLDGTTLQGELPVTDATQTSYGVFLNDATGSKMDYYMDVDTASTWCSGVDGSPEATMQLTLRSAAPADAANLPGYITGGGNFGVAPGVTQTVAYLYLPEGAELVSAIPTGGLLVGGDSAFVHQGRTVLVWTLDLDPGAEASVTIRSSTPATELLQTAVTPIIPERAGQTQVSCEPAS